jgi:hypothetical protein
MAKYIIKTTRVPELIPVVLHKEGDKLTNQFHQSEPIEYDL